MRQSGRGVVRSSVSDAFGTPVHATAKPPQAGARERGHQVVSGS
jgi:hypothetical protein